MKKLLNRITPIFACLLSLSLLLGGCDLLFGEDYDDTFVYDEGGMTMLESSSPDDSNSGSGTASGGLTYETFSFDDVPAYAGYYYTEINGNVPFFTEEELAAADEEYYEYYSPLDELGRCGAAMASVDTALMPDGDRGEIYWIHPSGWQKNSGYERTHLIAFQIAGESANEQNLITATHYLNNGGMLPFEEMVGDYVRETNTRVLYRVTPIYVGDELVARGVLMEAESLSDRGEDILYCIFVYNVFSPDEHKVIDYATGVVSDGELEIDETAALKVTYVLNRNSKVFHDPSCPNIDTISEKNKILFTGTREELIEKG